MGCEGLSKKLCKCHSELVGIDSYLVLGFPNLLIFLDAETSSA